MVQDEEYAGFGGPHCMVVGGYSQITDGLAQGLDVQLGCAASTFSQAEAGVKITCTNGTSLCTQQTLTSQQLLHRLYEM